MTNQTDNQDHIIAAAKQGERAGWTGLRFPDARAAAERLYDTQDERDAFMGAYRIARRERENR